MDTYAKLFTQLIIPECGSQFLLQVMLTVHKIVYKSTDVLVPKESPCLC